MASDLTAPPPATATPDDLGIDREFVVGMARVPLIAVLWAAAAWGVSAVIDQFGWYLTVNDDAINLGPLVVICGGMLLAAFIDGYAFKVPNWCTLSLVVSGWYIGLLHDVGSTAVPGGGGFLAALGGTALGFAFLFPALFIGGMGQGDVKMTMGFGSWVAAFFGLGTGAWVLWWSFAIGVLVGGVFGLVMMALRRQFYKNMKNFQEIITDLRVLVAHGPGKAAARANERRKDWVRLPYGVPLCVGFIGYLWYSFFVA
ncbi:A24 family peptidase [Fimbriiglobus ruber]|uniref:Type IV prepilin peptidase TadV/CpaA n=1 Tax=Fimbriiglobus ruber TaxID=1908690 RepID=A0A225DZ74_9BACT|nr:A24 family peptidase [Fimbriiglobus ruber]OWK41645.1 Type IV prepilin peptidase TadV/CpaA [Fimbriiglobus ruber]